MQLLLSCCCCCCIRSNSCEWHSIRILICFICSIVLQTKNIVPEQLFVMYRYFVFLSWFIRCHVLSVSRRVKICFFLCERSVEIRFRSSTHTHCTHNQIYWCSVSLLPCYFWVHGTHTLCAFIYTHFHFVQYIAQNRSFLICLFIRWNGRHLHVHTFDVYIK